MPPARQITPDLGHHSIKRPKSKNVPNNSNVRQRILATLKEIPLVHGKFTNTGRTVYAPQVPWVFTGTLRDNILFNSPYAEDRYWKVIYACALDKDIGEFPNGESP